MITVYTPAAKYHCRDCGDLFIKPGWTLRRGQKLSDNGHFYRVELCPLCESENIESVFEYRMTLAQRTKEQQSQ